MGPGRYETTQPIPVHGNWKSLVRLHNGNSLTAVPIFLPRDVAIPAKEVPARAEFTRPFVADHQILQREQKAAASWLTVMAYGIVVLIALGLLALLVWGLHRLASGGGGPSREDRPPRRAPAATTGKLAGTRA